VVQSQPKIRSLQTGCFATKISQALAQASSTSAGNAETCPQAMPVAVARNGGRRRPRPHRHARRSSGCLLPRMRLLVSVTDAERIPRLRAACAR
jgi:hypothetical protein